MNSSNKRQSTRAHVSFPVTIEIDCGDGVKWVAQAMDISKGGILIWSVHPLPLNVPLVVHFPQEWERVFAVIKAVRHEDFLFGCEFIDLPDKIACILDSAADKFSRQKCPKPLNTLWAEQT